MRANAGADVIDDDTRSSPATQLGFTALALVCALNTLAVVALLACRVRRRLRMRRDDDVISVASEPASEPSGAQS